MLPASTGERRQRDVSRGKEPPHGFDADAKRDDGKNKGAGETGQLTNLAGSEGETSIARMAPGIAVGEGGDTERTGMGRHVEAVGKQRHRACEIAGGDFANHHGESQDDDDARAPGIVVMCRAKEIVIVRESFDRSRKVRAACHLE